MIRYKAIMTAIAVVVGLAGLIIIGMPYVIKVKPNLSPQEQQLAEYQYQKVELNQRNPRVFSGMKNPMAASIEFPGKRDGQRAYPGEKLTDIAPPRNSTARDTLSEKPPGVSFIVIKKHSRMAILNGQAVREGDTIYNGRIVRITKTGVLIKTQEGQRWIYIE